MNNMKILITGGAGFIGSNIVEYLAKNNVKFIRILDNLSTGNKNNIQYLLELYDNIEFIYGDITNLDTCRNAMNNIDVICHQAAIGSVSRSIIDPMLSHSSNVNGFLNIIIAAKELNIKRIVYASSSSVYGDDIHLPKIEESIGNVLSPYAATKRIDEIYANVFTTCYEMECIGLRYFNIFGPKQSPNGPYAAVIPAFINSMQNSAQLIINGDGSYSRDFTYVDNAVYANILALTTNNKNCFGQVFNIGTGEQTTILELFNLIKNELNISINPIFSDKRIGDVPHSLADISKASSYLGYIPMVSFKEGIVKTITYNLNKNKNKILIEDLDYNKLLNRETIVINNNKVTEYLTNKTILITGGCGSIGSEIVRQLLQLNIKNIYIIDNAECSTFYLQNELKNKFGFNIDIYLRDINEINKIEKIFMKLRPNIVFHCAAYKHVPIMEHNPSESIKVNVIGTKNIADLSLKYNVEKFIMISTDKAVNPTSIMGVSKRIAELYVNYLNKEQKTQYITTRFGNVLGSSGSVIPVFLDRINKNQNILLTHIDIIRYFMTIPEAAQLVIKSVEIGSYNDILLFNMGKPIKIIDLARNLLIMCNKKLNIDIIGLRPGEKLYEELLYNGENIISTKDSNIMKLKHNLIIDDFIDKFNYFILNYENLLENNKFKPYLKELVPEYNYNNN